MRVIQIVPGLVPKVDGIGDYALQLARRLRDDHRIDTQFIVCDPNWAGNGLVEGFRVVRIEAKTAESLIAAIDRSNVENGAATGSKTNCLQVLVHFSLYSYQLRGCAFWLVRGLERCHRGGFGSVHVAFHELEDRSNKPWKSNFWLPLVQQRLILRVARIANYRYTNTALHQQRLRSLGVHPVDLILNFSTMEEPVEYPPFSKRARELIVFGRRDQRRLTYERAASALARVCHTLGVTNIVDIGEPIPGQVAADIEGIAIERCGILSKQDVRRRMDTALASFMYYRISQIGKSSVHATSCACGTLPFVFDTKKNESPCSALIEGVDFIQISDSWEVLPLPSLESMSKAVFERYQLRSSHVAAAQLASHFIAELELKDKADTRDEAA